MNVPVKVYHITANTYAAELSNENKKYTIPLINCIYAVGGTAVNDQNLVGVFSLNGAMLPGLTLFKHPGYTGDVIKGATLANFDPISVDQLITMIEYVKRWIIKDETTAEWLNADTTYVVSDVDMIMSCSLNKGSPQIVFYYYYILTNCEFQYKKVEQDICFVVE